jgi:hypothetical protein
MHFAYVDESGDVGLGGSRTYTLGCVLVAASDWPLTFDRAIGFRRHLRQLFGVPVRAEVKANYLLRNGGPFRTLKLSERARFAIYRQHLRLHAKIGLRTFAVVVDKSKLAATDSAHDRAWEYLLQRLERFTYYNGTHVALVHDEGTADQVRKLARKSRRAGIAGSMIGSGVLKVPFTKLIDDPVARDSRQSYFLQHADLAAYAAFRRVQPPPERRIQIVPQNMWDNLGTAALGDVNKYSGGPPGIVTT